MATSARDFEALEAARCLKRLIEKHPGYPDAVELDTVRKQGLKSSQHQLTVNYAIRHTNQRLMLENAIEDLRRGNRTFLLVWNQTHSSISIWLPPKAS